MTVHNGDHRGRVIIAGGSIAGLFAGALLHRSGFSVEILERSGEALASRGAGIVSHPELFDALSRAGAALDETIGVKVAGRITLDRDGTSMGEHALPQIMMSWDRLYRLLREAFPQDRYRSGTAVDGFEQDGGGVTVHLSDGRSERADWLIGADGIRSTVRRQLLPDLEPVYAGYVAWRGLIEESAMSAEAWRALGDRLAFCLPAGEQIVGYPVPGRGEQIGPGGRRYNFVWYRPADETTRLPTLLTGRDGRRYVLAIPPNQTTAGAVAELRAAAAALLAPAFAEVVRLTRQPFIQAIYDLESPRLLFDRVVLTGDAAFVARPHAGMGATKAALDAMTLAPALAAPDPSSTVGSWEQERLRYGHALVERARWLGAYLGTESATHEHSSAVLKERATTLMAETAVSGWLRS